jgi:hypothetical protein
MWWVYLRETTAPAMHTMASRDFAPSTPDISADSCAGSSRCSEVSRDAEISKPYSTRLAITTPNRLREEHGAPPRWTQHVCEIRK